MSSPAKGTGLLASASSAVQRNRFVRPGYDPRRAQPGASSEATTQNRAEQSPVVTTKKHPRILLVEQALALREFHVSLLRSVPAIVETLACCADLYLHAQPTYALVILVLHSQSGETAEAAHFVRRRWNTARILLLESESAVIDDWLYDERIDPQLHPAALREAAIRLITKENYWIPA